MSLHNMAQRVECKLKAVWQETRAAEDAMNVNHRNSNANIGFVFFKIESLPVFYIIHNI